MVAIPVPSANSALTLGLLKRKAKVSSSSICSSPIMGTETVFCVSPGSKVRVPDVSLKSLPLFALSSNNA